MYFNSIIHSWFFYYSHAYLIYCLLLLFDLCILSLWDKVIWYRFKVHVPFKREETTLLLVGRSLFVVQVRRSGFKSQLRHAVPYHLLNAASYLCETCELCIYHYNNSDTSLRCNDELFLKNFCRCELDVIK